MSNRILRNFFCVLFITRFAFLSYSQRPNSGMLGIEVGGTHTIDDINKFPLKNINYSLGIFYKHCIDKRFSLVGELSCLKLKGEGSFIPGSEEISYGGSLFELSPQIEFNFIPFIPGYKKHSHTPYVFTGVALGYYNSDVLSFLIGVPFGMGIKYNLSRYVIVGAEFSFRKTFTNDMDYKSKEAKQIQRQETYIGSKDWYSSFGINLAYKIKYSSKCPTFN